MRSSSAEVERFPHGQVPRALREHQLLELGEQLFAERGYEGMTMNELARRAGVSKPVIYAIVRSKDELYRRCFQRAADELADAVASAATLSAGDLGSMVYAGNLAFFDFIASHAQAFEMLFAEDAGGRHAAEVRRIRTRQARLLSAVLVQRTVDAGVDADRQRIELAVTAVNGAAEALAHWWRANPELSAEELAAGLTALLLPGLTALTA